MKFCHCQDDFSPENLNINGCPIQIPGDCVYYTGVTIPKIGITSGDSFNTVVQKFSVYFGALSGDVESLELAVDVLGGTTPTTTSSTTTTTTTAGGTTTTTSSTTTTTTTVVNGHTIYM